MRIPDTHAFPFAWRLGGSGNDDDSGETATK